MEEKSETSFQPGSNEEDSDEKSELPIRTKKSFSAGIHSKKLNNKDRELIRAEFLRSLSYLEPKMCKEFIPKPKPKESTEHVSPMKLNRKFYNPKTETILLNKEVDCISCPDDENIDDSIYSEETQSLFEEEPHKTNFVAEMRKEMSLKCEKTSNEYETILNINDIIHTAENKEKKSKCLFRKYINNPEPQGRLCFSYGPEVLSKRNTSAQKEGAQSVKHSQTKSLYPFSLLRILESAAKEKKSVGCE